MWRATAFPQLLASDIVIQRRAYPVLGKKFSLSASAYLSAFNYLPTIDLILSRVKDHRSMPCLTADH